MEKYCCSYLFKDDADYEWDGFVQEKLSSSAILYISAIPLLEYVTRKYFPNVMILLQILNIFFNLNLTSICYL